MKKLSISIVALALFFSTSAFHPTPGDDTSSTEFFNVSNARTVRAENVAEAVSKAFSAKFTNAKDVTWKENSGFFFVEFQVKDKALKAAYLEDGEMVAMSRTVSIDLLPMAVTEALSDRYANYVMPLTVTEIVMNGATNYYMIVQGKTRNLQLKCSPDGNITIDKKFKKKILVGSVL